MATIFKYAMRRYLGQILGWGIAFGLVAFYLMVIYKPMITQQAELQGLFDAYGETMMAFFGGSADFLSPAGYLDFTFFSYIPVVAGIFAVLMGAGLLAADEEKGTLDLILAYPVSRAAVYWGRCLAFCAATTAILALTWIGFAVGLPLAGWKVSALALLLPHLSLLVILLAFGALALLFSMVLPSRAVAASVAGGLMVLSYLVNSLARVNERLEALDRLLPLRYYQGGRALSGLGGLPLLGLLTITAGMAALAWWRFERRDIRVSGEGSWNLPRFRPSSMQRL
jgi:ABC-2 type transport system permease protein